MKKYIFLIIICLFSLILLGDYHYLKDPENRDISNNNITIYNNQESIYLKYTSDDSISYYIIRPFKDDTFAIKKDTLGIFRIEIIPDSFEYGNYWVEIFDKNKNKVLDFYFTKKEYINYFKIILNILLGLIFFIMGLKSTSKGLSHISGYRLKELLWNFSNNVFKGTFVGVLLTIILQSSTAFSVMITNFVNEGLIGIVGALSMLAGSAIGTSIIVQIIAFNISFFSIILIIIGFFIYDRNKKIKNIGRLIFGFGLIFFSINFMANAMIPIKDTAYFINIIMFLQNHLIYLFIITALFTFSVHSSAVVIALIIGLSLTGSIPYRGAVVMIAAANLGTTFTASMSALRANRKAKYVAFVNALLKLITGIIFIFILFMFEHRFADIISNARSIANLHLTFNIMFALLLIIMMPIIHYFGLKIKEKTISIMNKRILSQSINETPLLAIGHIYNEILNMANVSYTMLERSFYVFKMNDDNLLNEIVSMDDKIDNYEKGITLLIVRLYEEELPSYATERMSKMMFIVDEIEHIGDSISKNLMVLAKKKIENNYYFSDEGFDDLKEMYKDTLNTAQRTLSIMAIFDKNEAEYIKRRRSYILDKLNKLHIKHLTRIQSGIKESIETSTVHLDILNEYERINFHFYKICNYVVELEQLNERDLQRK